LAYQTFWHLTVRIHTYNLSILKLQIFCASISRWYQGLVEGKNKWQMLIQSAVDSNKKLGPSFGQWVDSLRYLHANL